MQVLYRVAYVCYRFLSCISVIIIVGLGYLDWASEGNGLTQLIILLGLGLYWSFIFWSSPDLLSDHWEKQLPEHVWQRKPSVLWLPAIVLSLIAVIFAHTVVISFMILVLIPRLQSLLFFAILLVNLLTILPISVGIGRLFLHMRSGRRA